MRKYAGQGNGEAWKPAARVTELAAEGRGFNS
jgi:3-hydroxyacyl-CoA dehydrogenase